MSLGFEISEDGYAHMCVNPKFPVKLQAAQNAQIQEVAMQDENDIAIWFENGSTAYFKDVELVKNTKRKLTFYYTSASTNQRRYAQFDRYRLAGVSFTAQDEVAV